MKKDNWFIKTFQNPWFICMVVTVFTAVISFFQINSYWADQHHFNGIKGWLGIGIFFSGLSIFFLYMTNKTSKGTGG